jgi:hypothetical protein
MHDICEQFVYQRLGMEFRLRRVSETSRFNYQRIGLFARVQRCPSDEAKFVAATVHLLDIDADKRRHQPEGYLA